MSIRNTVGQLRERFSVMWLARTEQERKLLTIGGAVVLLAIFYLVLVAPAVEGRAQLQKSLPNMRQQAAQLNAMALEAGALSRQPPVQVTPMTRETLAASLSARSITPQSLVMTGEFAKLQVNGVSFANLVAWLDAARRDNRIAVQDAAFTAVAAAGQPALGLVDATITLHQNTGTPAAGAR